MSLREILNLWAYLMVLVAVGIGFDVLDVLKNGSTVTWMEYCYLLLSFAPGTLLLVTGQAYGVAFFSALFSGGASAGQHHYSKERSWARDGRGKEVAQALLWRDRVKGDIPGLIAILEMARVDRNLAPEALRATHRLLGNRRLKKADRDHVGRLLSMLQLSESKPHDVHREFEF